MKAARLGDVCSGHGLFPSRESVSGSNNVYINRKGAHRVGDKWASHCDPVSCHNGVTSTGSKTVFINGVQAARVGDSVNCGSTIKTGSNDVHIG